MSELWTRLLEQPVALVIPFVSAFVGWFTNVLAIKMMFYPTRFVGVRPFLGWQGLVPANARKLAAYTTRLITRELMRLEELFESFDPEGFSGELEHVVERITDQVIEEARGRMGPLWDSLDDSARANVRTMVESEVRSVVVAVLADFKRDITDIVDLERVVTDAVERDRGLVSELFLRVGSEEFRFIARSGAWFGFAFGLVQMLIWLVHPVWWTLPLAGFFVGYATNWIAIKLIFEPAEPVRIGPFVLQGLFHKRQREVASQFAQLVSTKVLNADNIVRVVLEGEGGARIFAIIEHRLDELIERAAKHPMAGMLPESEREALRDEVLGRVRAELPERGGFLHTFAARAIDMQGEMFERMTRLEPKSFEGVLRPAFQQDEWKLIIAGAGLGTVAGVVQLLSLFADSLA